MKEPHPFKIIYNKNKPVYYRFIDNHSEKTVVFLHGLFATSSIFRHFLKFIPWNVILIELRGIVYSKCESPYIENYVEDLKLVLTAEKIEKKVILAGYSLGCSIINEFAERYPEKVEKAIMMAPINKSFREIGRRRFAAHLIAGLGKNFFKKWKEYLRLQMNCPWYRLMGLFNYKLLKEAHQKMELTDKCEVIIINGKADAFFNFKDARLHNPNIRHECMENINHFMFLTKDRIACLQTPLLKHLCA